MTTIGLIGGTGDIGSALAIHLAKKNDRVLIGSRNKEKAQSTIFAILLDKKDREDLKNHLQPATNDVVAAICDTVIFSVPYSAAIETIDKLSDKFTAGDQILISAVAGIEKTKNEFTPVRNRLSVSKYIRQVVPSSVRVASAFQTIPAGVLYKEEKIDADVLVCCDEPSTYEKAARIVSSIDGLRPLYAGSLELSYEIEALTAVLLNIAAHDRLKSPTFKIRSF
jgi:NADPH-dependent F420 reductase